ncbi:MAG: hypothetical protein AAGA85_11915 [Bacteroidota bacterium]
MHLKISSDVESSLATVKQGFTEALFLKLSPPFPRVRLARFDGSSPGDIVSLELDFVLFKQRWTSEIVSEANTNQEWVFVDEGKELPFFLSRWRHQHEVHAQEDGARIVDNIEYATGWILTDIIMYPAMYLQFLYRKPIYKRFFSKK